MFQGSFANRELHQYNVTGEEQEGDMPQAGARQLQCCWAGAGT